jgi:hypothetical protein
VKKVSAVGGVPSFRIMMRKKKNVVDDFMTFVGYTVL